MRKPDSWLLSAAPALGYYMLFCLTSNGEEMMKWLIVSAAYSVMAIIHDWRDWRQWQSVKAIARLSIHRK